VYLDATVRVEQRHAQEIAFEQALPQPLGSPQRVVGLDQFEILAPEFLDLLRHQAGLDVRQRLGRDQTHQPVLPVDEHDILVKLLAMPRQRFRQHGARRCALLEDERMVHLGQVRRSLAIERKPIPRPEQPAQSPAGAQPHHPILPHQRQKILRVVTKHPLHFFQRQIVRHGAPLVNQRVERHLLGRHRLQLPGQNLLFVVGRAVRRSRVGIGLGGFREH